MTAKGSGSRFNTGKNVNNITVSELLQTVASHPNIFLETSPIRFLCKIIEILSLVLLILNEILI